MLLLKKIFYTLVLWAVRFIYRHMGYSIIRSSDISTKRSTSGISVEELIGGLLGCILLVVQVV